MPTTEALHYMATWVAAIADNVKNPIASITAVLDVAEGRLHDSEHVGASIAQVRDRLAALNEYVSELADFARPAVVAREPSQLSQIVEEALEGTSLPSVCEAICDVPTALVVDVDRAKLTLVVKALLRNAFEAIDPSRAPKLRITAAGLASGNVSLSVEDNGPGLGSDTAARAFEPFFSTKEAGTGLGLAIVRKYVEAHGGTIAIDRSPLLGGCRILFTMPGGGARDGSIRSSSTSREPKA